MPATVGKLEDAEVAVSGMTAWTKDFVDIMKSNLPIVFAFVLALAFVLLLVTFRSIVIPIKAIVLNLLSVGAAYGILTLVFQDGHGESLLGFNVGRRHHAVAAAVPVRDPVRALDGLPRLRPEPDPRGVRSRHDAPSEAVAHGIKSTAGVITSAAAVMVITFAMFATGSDQSMKQLGVGLAAAILIDATSSARCCCRPR